MTDRQQLGINNVTDKEHQQFYSSAFAIYRNLFGPMDQAARALCFFTMDEAEILSYAVSAGEDPSEASIRHGVKLAAMADALESLLGVEAQLAMWCHPIGPASGLPFHEV